MTLAAEQVGSRNLQLPMLCLINRQPAELTLAKQEVGCLES